jgi:hypothetical protein
MDNNDSDIDDSEESEAFAKLKETIIKRCKVAGIKTEEDEDDFLEGKSLLVYMPSGRDTVPVYISSERRAEAFLSLEFEKFKMLGDYVGIYSHEKSTIEAPIRSIGGFGGPTRFLRRRLFDPIDEEDEEISPIVLKEQDSETSTTIQIGEASEEFSAIYGSRIWSRSMLSVKISNTGARTHDATIRLLEKLTNSLFFQIDLQLGIPLTLQRERSRNGHRTRKRSELGKREDLKFPEREYDQQPISLYWYAKSAVGLPLLQFLAYYQVLEFFMPTYSNHDAVGKIKNILKDPRFNPERDSQITRILATLRPSKRGFGDERSQFESVIRQCVSQEELRDFFESSPQISEYYTSEYKPISEKKIPLNNKESDHIQETALRLYEIRCRIVHTKDQSDKELQLLLPFSKETSDLHFDIALIEFISTAVLVASSAPLKNK